MKNVSLIVFLLFSMACFSQNETKLIKENQLIYRIENDTYMFCLAFFTPSAPISDGYNDGYALFQMCDYINGKGKIISTDIEYRDIGNNRLKLYIPHTDKLFMNVEFHNNNIYLYNAEYEFVVKIPRIE
jgi:hypothetical protein